MSRILVLTSPVDIAHAISIGLSVLLGLYTTIVNNKQQKEMLLLKAEKQFQQMEFIIKKNNFESVFRLKKALQNKEISLDAY